LSEGTEGILGGGKGIDVSEQPLQVRVLAALGKADRLEVGWGKGQITEDRSRGEWDAHSSKQPKAQSL